MEAGPTRERWQTEHYRRPIPFLFESAQAARLAGANPWTVNATLGEAVATVAGEIAYVFGLEEVRTTSNGQVRHLTGRATNIYRREADGWKLVYRHADAPPIT